MLAIVHVIVLPFIVHDPADLPVLSRALALRERCPNAAMTWTIASYVDVHDYEGRVRGT